MCKKCSVIVQRNYRVRDIGRNHVCFSCAEQHGARLAQTSSAKTVDDAGSDVGSEVFHFDYTDTTASSAYGGDDVLSVATATDDESEGDDLLHHHAAANGTATRLTRRRSSSGSTSSAARARSASGIQYGRSPTVLDSRALIVLSLTSLGCSLQCSWILPWSRPKSTRTHP
jgi:hypothetical protein